MNSRHIQIFMLTAALSLIYCLPGAQPLSELIDIALERNRGIQADHQQYLSLLEVGDQVNQLPDPVAGAGVFVRSPETRVGPQVARISISQMFPWKGTLQARKDVATARAMTAFERTESSRREVVYQVKNAYFSLYELEQSQEIIRRSIRIYDALDQYTLARLESGKGTAADVLRIQLKRQELEQEIRILENRKAKPLARINQALYRAVDTPVQITDTLPLAQMEINLDTLGQFLQLHHPAIRSLSRQQNVSRKEIELNKLNRKPSFGLGMDYVFVNRRTNVELADNGKNILMPMAQVQIPLNTGKYEAKDREEQLMITALDQRIEDLKLLIMSEIKSALAEIDDAGLRIDLYEQLAKTTRTTLGILQTQYSSTGQNFDELLRMQNELVMYDLKTLKAIVQSHQAKAIIEKYLSI